MIKSYEIHNFKNHANTKLELGHLTILTGINGMGKSSVLQSMLVLRESFMRNPQMPVLTLDGESFELGGSASLVNGNMAVGQQDMLRLVINENHNHIEFVYNYPKDDKDELEADESLRIPNANIMGSISLFNNDFQYLSAFRTGPRLLYGSNTSVVDKHRQISQKMGMGEFAVNFLNKFGAENIAIEALQYPGSQSLGLYQQTEYWLSEISDGISFKINQLEKQLEIRFGYEQAGKTTVYHSALNTGFGISYILSIIVAVLSAKPGALILIENPEAHIHPSGQAALMRLITLAAGNGVQIVLETHSDHIVNGALVTIKEHLLEKKLLTVYFFDRDVHFNAYPIKLSVGESGRLQNVPKGFFDQMKMDLEVLYEL